MNTTRVLGYIISALIILLAISLVIFYHPEPKVQEIIYNNTYHEVPYIIEVVTNPAPVVNEYTYYIDKEDLGSVTGCWVAEFQSGDKMAIICPK